MQVLKGMITKVVGGISKTVQDWTPVLGSPQGAMATASEDSVTGEIVTDKSTGGAAHTMDGFKPSQYDADLTMNGTAQSVALATSVSLGSGRVRVVNLGATTEAIRFAFGTSAANAEANLTHVTNLATTGLYIPSNVDAPGAGIVILGVPALATHYAVENAVAADVQVVSVTQGV